MVVTEDGDEKVVACAEVLLASSPSPPLPPPHTPLPAGVQACVRVLYWQRLESVVGPRSARLVHVTLAAHLPPSLPPSPPTHKTVNMQSLIEADTGAVGTKFYHLSNSALLITAPLAFFLSPSILSFPLDLFLGVVFPLHAHIGFNYIISDYVPKASRAMARYALAGVTGITILGLTKLNFDGPGLTESFKSLWREEKKK